MVLIQINLFMKGVVKGLRNMIKTLDPKYSKTLK